MKRISELENLWRTHQGFLPSFSMNEFHGSATMLFYPIINILPIAFCHIFIKSNITLLYLFIDLNILISLIISYYSSLKFSKSKYVSFIFSIVYSMSFTFLFNAFFNADLGSLTAIACFPLAIFGLINILKGSFNLEFVCGVTMVMYSHILSSLILLGLISLIILLNITRLHKLQIKGLIVSIIFIILLTAIIWVPIIYLEINNINDIFPPSSGKLIGISFASLFKSSLIGYARPYLNIFSLISIFMTLLVYKHLNRYEKQFYLISILIVIFGSNFMPWHIINNIMPFKIFKILQYTYRIYIIPQLLLSYLFAASIMIYLHNNNVRLVATLLIFTIVMILQMTGQRWYVHDSCPRYTSTYVNHITYYKKSSDPIFRNYGVHCPVINHPAKNVVSGGYYSYKVSNNRDLRRLVNSTSTDDYYPKKSLSYINSIDNYRCIFNSKAINLKHIGYNKFIFYSASHINKLSLPFVVYNGEKLQVNIDHRLIPVNINPHHTIDIKDIPRGCHKLSIEGSLNPIVSIFKYCLTIIGLLIVLYNKLIKY